MANVLMHVDLNCFFARCEVIKNPSLKGKAIAIGALGRRGVISTCSYEARKFGVRSGIPTFMALDKCPNLILLPGDYEYYSLMSKEFIAYAHKFTSKVEQASIDECYIDITDLVKNVDIHKFLKNFQIGLLSKTGLECSIGVGPTRFLAKMGSDYKKPMGITIIRKKDIISKLYPLKINDFFGIGSKTAPKLRMLGINTIGDFANFLKEKEDTARAMLGNVYEEYLSCLNGSSDDEIYSEATDPKSIGNSMTLMMDTSDEEEVSRALFMMSEEVGARLKSNRVRAKTIQLVLKDTEFKAHLKSHTLEKAINDINQIHQEAMSLYNKYFKHLLIRLVGITMSNLLPLHEENVQLSFFEETPVDEVSEVINHINRKFKKKVVDKASIMLKEKRYGHH